MREFEMNRFAWERWYNSIVGKDCKYYDNPEISEDMISTDDPFAALLDKAFPKDAPGHTDLMVPPESIDDYLKKPDKITDKEDDVFDDWDTYR